MPRWQLFICYPLNPSLIVYWPIVFIINDNLAMSCLSFGDSEPLLLAALSRKPPPTSGYVVYEISTRKSPPEKKKSSCEPPPPGNPVYHQLEFKFTFTSGAFTRVFGLFKPLDMLFWRSFVPGMDSYTRVKCTQRKSPSFLYLYRNEHQKWAVSLSLWVT